jgi:hypothetical protein
VPGLPNGVEPTDSMLALAANQNPSVESPRNGLKSTSTTSANVQLAPSQSIDCCFSDTVVQVFPGETSMVCSMALSLIFRNNYKGLSMAELQRHLQPGMRAPSGPSGECRIEDSVLFRVLVDISTKGS